MSIFKTKRLPCTIGVLLIGVMLAGMAADFIATPQSENAYLHEHLSAGVADREVRWHTSSSALPTQDKLSIAQIITKMEHPDFVPDADQPLTGQAMDVARKNYCLREQEICNFPIRLNRSLTASHLNDDFRVMNIQENSLRVDVEMRPGVEDVSLTAIAHETRLLRFYQTQAGWIQSVSEELNKTPLLLEDRTDKFYGTFSSKLVGLNYYPATASWKDFWVKFPIEEIKNDLEKIQDLNVNSLRIFLTHDYFDDAKTREDAKLKLRTFLDLCDDKNIQVLVTLFDLRPNYNLTNWVYDIDHIDRVLSDLADHSAILGIDIKNQADLDFEHFGEGRVEAWITAMARYLHVQYPDLAVTVGWSHADNATRLSDVVDFISYHEYQDPEGFGDRLRGIISAVDGKPVMITELGSTIWQPPFIPSLGEAAQASRLEDQLSQASSASGVFVWTLNDFDHVGPEVVGPLPWRQAQQRHFGLLRPDGSLRPAAGILIAHSTHSN